MAVDVFHLIMNKIITAPAAKFGENLLYQQIPLFGKIPERGTQENSNGS